MLETGITQSFDVHPDVLTKNFITKKLLEGFVEVSLKLQDFFQPTPKTKYLSVKHAFLNSCLSPAVVDGRYQTNQLGLIENTFPPCQPPAAVDSNSRVLNHHLNPTIPFRCKPRLWVEASWVEKASWPKSRSNVTHQTCTGWWFHKSFSPRKFGEDEPYFDDHIFQRGWFNHQEVEAIGITRVFFFFFEMAGLNGAGEIWNSTFQFSAFMGRDTPKR